MSGALRLREEGAPGHVAILGTRGTDRDRPNDRAFNATKEGNDESGDRSAERAEHGV